MHSHPIIKLGTSSTGASFVVNVSLVTGDTNLADMFTKIVSEQLYDNYRKFVLGTQGEL